MDTSLWPLTPPVWPAKSSAQEPSALAKAASAPRLEIVVATRCLRGNHGMMSPCQKKTKSFCETRKICNFSSGLKISIVYFTRLRSNWATATLGAKTAHINGVPWMIRALLSIFFRSDSPKFSVHFWRIRSKKSALVSHRKHNQSTRFPPFSAEARRSALCSIKVSTTWKCPRNAAWTSKVHLPRSATSSSGNSWTAWPSRNAVSSEGEFSSFWCAMTTGNFAVLDLWLKTLGPQNEWTSDSLSEGKHATQTSLAMVCHLFGLSRHELRKVLWPVTCLNTNPNHSKQSLALNFKAHVGDVNSRPGSLSVTQLPRSQTCFFFCLLSRW